MEYKDPLMEKLASGELALGAAMKGGPHVIPSLANAGLDFVRPDLMYSAIDWRELDHMVKASKASGITPWVRVPSNPWFGGHDNLQSTVDAGRAFSLGASVVQVTVASAFQCKALLEVAKDWHRSAAGVYPGSLEELEAQEESIKHEALFIPSVESLSGLEEIDEILALPGMRAIFIAGTDLAAQLGHPMDYEHPEVLRVFDKIIASAAAKDIAVVTNTGFPYQTPDEIAQRIKRLFDSGVRVVMMQTVEFLLSVYCRKLVSSVAEIL